MGSSMNSISSRHFLVYTPPAFSPSAVPGTRSATRGTVGTNYTVPDFVHEIFCKAARGRMSFTDFQRICFKMCISGQASLSLGEEFMGKG